MMLDSRKLNGYKWHFNNENMEVERLNLIDTNLLKGYNSKAYDIS